MTTRGAGGDVRDQLRTWSDGLFSTLAILTAQRLGLFARLARGPKSPEQLRRALGADGDALRRLLDALVGMGLLERRRDRVALAKRCAVTLDPDSPESILPVLDHQWYLLQAWLHLEGAVLDGASRALDLDALYTDPARNRAFNHAMRVYGREGAQELLGAYDFKDANAVLDVGGGAGEIAATVCAKRKGLRWTILDRPAALTLARRRMRDDGLADRVHFVVNDALEGGWPADHDTVLLSQMIHCFDERGVRRLISHAAKVLPTGGRLIIRDFLPPKVGAPTHETGLFGLNMLLNTGGGRVYSAPTVKRLLAPAFRAERLIDAGKTQVLIARRR